LRGYAWSWRPRVVYLVKFDIGEIDVVHVTWATPVGCTVDPVAQRKIMESPERELGEGR